ncbi:MAG: hypothetical protein IPL35_07075 [Sphingobacteriales bacterium]|nr:hypothetical protein [Sphingobacteriales bacterium]
MAAIGNLGQRFDGILRRCSLIAPHGLSVFEGDIVVTGALKAGSAVQRHRTLNGTEWLPSAVALQTRLQSHRIQKRIVCLRGVFDEWRIIQHFGHCQMGRHTVGKPRFSLSG